MSSSVAVPPPNVPAPSAPGLFDLKGETPTHARASIKIWDERMGETANIAKNYRNLSYASTAGMVCAAGFACYLSMQGNLRVLEVARTLDGTQIIGVAEGISLTPSDYVVAEELRRWIIDTRRLTKDWKVTKDDIGEAYKMMATNSQASRFMDNYYRSPPGDPWLRSKNEWVAVTGSAAVPMTHEPNSKGERTWKIEWTEQIHSIKDDSVIRTQYNSAIVTYFIQPHRRSDTDEQIKANPHGIMINFIAIS